MRKLILYILFSLLPILIIVSVNETSRVNRTEVDAKVKDGVAINTDTKMLNKCTWACYYDTKSHCKGTHTVLAKPYFKYIDPIYFGIIKSMSFGGNYQVMNVIFLVILIPLLILTLMVRAIEMGYKIKALKKKL